MRRRAGRGRDQVLQVLPASAPIHRADERNEQEEDGSFKSIEKQYNEVVKSFCRDLGVTVVDPLPVFEEAARGKPVFRQGNDHHWSSLAHQVAARELLRVLTQENLLTE